MDRGEFPHLTDSQFESVRKMVGIFGGDALRSLAAATPAEQVERIEAFDTYERGLIAHVQGLQTPVAPVAEVELAIVAALISTERLRVAFALSNLGGRVKTWAYTREATTPGCFTTWAQLCQQLRAAFLPANYEYRQRSRFLACKQGKRELHEYIQEMRVLAASLVGNPLPEHIKVTVFMDGLKVGPSRTQLFRVHTNTMEEAIQIALQEAYSHRQTVARNGDKYADALRESKGRGQVSVRLADGTVFNVPGVRMDLAVKFEDFDSTESFLVQDMDKYDLILGMPWLEKHEPWIDWRGKAIGASRPAVSDRALVSNVRTSVRDWGARDGRQGPYAPEEVLGVTDFNEDVAMSLATGRETKAHCQACGIVKAASANAESLPRKVEETEKKNESAARASRYHTRRLRLHRHGRSKSNKVSSTACPAIHLGALPEVSALLNLEELSMKNVLVELKAGYISEIALLLPEISPEDLNSSSIMDEDVPEGFTKQRSTRLGSEILKNPVDPVYPLVNEFSDVVSNHPPSQLPLDRGQCEIIDAFFAEKAKSGMVRESKSPHSTLTFCVRKPNGKWRLVHANNKLNNAMVPAQTPISPKGVLLNNMSGCTLYSALDLIDGYYQILMRESDIPLTAEAIAVHLKRLRRVFEVMKANKLYANIDKWKSMSPDFVFGLPADDKGNTGILVFVCRLSKMVHLAPVCDKVTGKQAAQLFLDIVFRYHGLPETIVSDRDPRFTGAFWDTLFQLLGTKLTMSTADHPQTDGQTKRVNRVLEDTLRSIWADAPRSWSDQLPMVEFPLNNAGGSRNSAVNTPMELSGLTTKSVQVLAKDLKGPRLASLRGSLTTRSKPKGYLDRINAISKLTDLVT
ncbi:Gag protein [Phytophthora palmivora]|uniref:Gag protein n=1 Tax=Phytophthora palmivora TaxID=4796 RepID=A0A2P4XME6_9STRA|nr:Gag protein [Phytophthora palmivora]